MSAANKDQQRLKQRLYWRCRRGMLELDYLLQHFISHNFTQLTDTELTAFQQLLDTPDAVLIEYLMGRSVPLDTRLCHVVEKIRNNTAY